MLARSLRSVVATSRRCASSSAEQFYAASVKSFNGQVEIVKRKVRALSNHELLVAVDSAGLNASDIAMINGQHYLRPELPFVPGFELAGEVMAIGKDVKDYAVGDRVCALKTVGTGAFAQRCVVDASAAIKLPHKVPYEKAASMLVAYCTALHTLKNVLRVKEGGKLLVVASQGGTALACVDLALNVFKCQVVVATSTDANCEVARQMGVLATVEYTDENMPKLVYEHTKGVDYCVEAVGGHWFDLSLKCLRSGGHLASLGGGGASPSISIDTLLKNQLTITGVSLGALCVSQSNALPKLLNTIIEWQEERYCHPKFALQYPLKDLNAAIKYLTEKPPLGKVIITCRDEDMPTEEVTQ